MRSPAPLAALALACGCSLALDWDRAGAQPFDAAPADQAPPTDAAFDAPNDGPDPDAAAPDLPPVDHPSPVDRTCTPMCRGGERCCNGICQECCNAGDCPRSRVCCRGVCAERC